MINSHHKVLNVHILIIAWVESKLIVVVLGVFLIQILLQSLINKGIASIHQLGIYVINVKQGLLEQGPNHHVWIVKLILLGIYILQVCFLCKYFWYFPYRSQKLNLTLPKNKEIKVIIMIIHQDTPHKKHK